MSKTVAKHVHIPSSLKHINSIGVFKKIITVADLGDQLKPLTLEGDIDNISSFLKSFLSQLGIILGRKC